MPNPSKEQIEKVYKKVVKKYSHRENVTGVDVGFRYDKGKRTKEMAVRIHVREKIPEHALKAEEIFPKMIDDVVIDVIEAVYKSHPRSSVLEPVQDTMMDRGQRFVTLQPGISVAHESVTDGTLGAIAYDRQTSRRGILSNWHVLVGSNDARPGDPIVQPAPKEGGRAPQDTIARLERFLLDQHGDAAFAILNAARQVDDTQLETDVRITKVRDVQVGDIVAKSGRTTGVTRGLVEGTGQYTITYSVGTRTIAGFKIVAEEDGNPNHLEISSGGDSGSLWFAISDNHGVGLHFAGESDPNPSEEYALACHLGDVLTQLDVTLEPTGEVPAPFPEAGTTSVGELARINSENEVTHMLAESVLRLSRILELTTSGASLRPAVAPVSHARSSAKPPARLRNKKNRPK
jgi:hypothetical protein